MATTPNRGYQLPAASSKLKEDVLRLIAALGAIDSDVAGLLTALAGKSDLGHGHAMAEITGLVAALGNKLDVGYHDALANLTDVDVAGVANGMVLLRQASKWIPVALQINNIAGLETALNGKATPADITAAINALIAAAPGALDTLNELATALGNDPDFATTVSAALGNRIRADATQAFAEAQKGQARANIGADLLGGLRNKIINGDFDFWQRGTSFSGVTGTVQFGPDRWTAFQSTSNIAWSRQDFTPGQTAVPGNPKHFGRLTISGGGSNTSIGQKIEDVRTLAGKRVTVVGYVKANTSSPTFNVALRQNFGSGGSSTVVTTALTAVSVSNGVWTKFSAAVDLPSISGKTVGDGSWLGLFLESFSTTGFTLDIAHISLVEGDATAEADPFSPRHIQQELVLCQRYYEKSFPQGVAPAQAAGTTGAISFAGQVAASPVDVALRFTTPKRASPSLVTYNTFSANANWGHPSETPTASIHDLGTTGVTLRASAAVSAGRAYSIHYTADAEL